VLKTIRTPAYMPVENAKFDPTGMKLLSLIESSDLAQLVMFVKTPAMPSMVTSILLYTAASRSAGDEIVKHNSAFSFFSHLILSKTANKTNVHIRCTKISVSKGLFCVALIRKCISEPQCAAYFNRTLYCRITPATVKRQNGRR
jgi:Fe-S-cluster containining protein